MAGRRTDYRQNVRQANSVIDKEVADRLTYILSTLKRERWLTAARKIDDKQKITDGRQKREMTDSRQKRKMTDGRHKREMTDGG
jgi:hypothetical protein